MRWIVKRLLMALLTIYVVTTITFFLIRFMPGDFVEMMTYYYMTNYGMSEFEAREMVYGLYGVELKDPLWLQYIKYMITLLHGSWGESYISHLSLIHI